MDKLDIRKIAMFLAGKLPPYYWASNLRSFTKQLRIFAKAEFTNDEMLFIQQQAKNIDEEIYFMVLDDLWRSTTDTIEKWKRSRDDIIKLMIELGVPDDVLGIMNNNDKKTINMDHNMDLDTLLSELSIINTWKEDAIKFEAWSKKFIKWMFEDSMKTFEIKEQPRSDDWLDIRDFMLFNNPVDSNPKISAFWWDIVKNTFWSTFTIIECKNYKDPANQDILVTTRKYLERPWIWNFCIILTRKWLNESWYKRTIKELQWAQNKNSICAVILDEDDYESMIKIKQSWWEVESYLIDRCFELHTLL